MEDATKFQVNKKRWWPPGEIVASIIELVTGVGRLVQRVSPVSPPP